MDEVTQQNAALVEEASAAARSLEEQAAGLSESVSQFRLKGVPSSAPVGASPRPAVKPVGQSGKAIERTLVRAPTRPAPSPGARRSAPVESGAKPPAAVEGAGGQTWTEF
jgi:methyl-accepting chemotaxis protein